MNTNTEHTVKAFDEDMQALRGLIAEMGGRAEQAIGNAMTALKQRNLELAQKVVEEDKAIDELEQQIDQLVIQTIALRAPMADDLRDLVAALKISGVVERIGDYAKNIAKRVPEISQTGPFEPVSLLPAMAQAAGQLVHDSLHAFATRDADLANDVCEGDKTVDDFYTSILRTTITYMIENPTLIGEAAHVLFIAKNLERVGDHATNVAEMVYFASTGEMMPDRPKGGDPENLSNN